MPEPSNIRALTIRRPWTDLIIRGKNVENRTWSTSYRGPVLIHVGQGWDPQARWFAQDLVPVGSTYWTQERHPQGIVAVAELVDVCSEVTGDCDCGPWAMRWLQHWQLDNVRALAVPAPVKGALGLWRPGSELVDAVMAGVAT